MDIEHLEAFALAEDRSEALKQLIPGTEDYYFYHCLDHLHRGRIAEARDMLKTWIQRHHRTARAQEIEHRIALLAAPSDAKGSFEHLRNALGLRFDHQREIEGRVTDYPHQLDPALISRKKLTADALSAYSNLHGFTDHALDWLIGEKLDPDRRKNLLERLTRPDYPQLVKLIDDELREKRSAGFGAMRIHAQLLQPQLDELARLRPALRDEANWVNTAITRLHPSPDVEWEHDPLEKEMYLERLWGFVDRLAATFNALKAHVLYHRLAFDRARGVYDKKRFTEYLRLPKESGYAKREYLEHRDRRHNVVHLGTSFQAQTLLDTVTDDNALVTDFLAHFFAEANDFDEFKEFVADDFLKRVFATTKILGGIGDQERWYSLLDDPTAYQQLKERVELELAPSNKTYFAANEAVTLAVDVKNVQSLVVKVFEINALNYFLAHKRDVDTSIDLDGLVSSMETTHEYTEPALRRVRRTFNFDALKKPGLYVIELIGSGRSSRALIRKGALRYVERLGAAGHAFTILDEENKPLPDATLWLGGREYTAKDGEILVPYSTSEQREKILLRHGELTTLDTFQHRAESYSFEAGVYVDRESLLSRKKADVLVRVVLRLNGMPVSASLFEEPVLEISSVDRHGISASREVSGWKVESAGESVHSIQVPEDLSSISFTVRGKVRSLSQQIDVPLSASTAFTLNQIELGNSIEALHLSKTDRGHVLYLLGKSGEARPHKPINLVIQHRDFTRTVDVTLQTDDDGRVELGALEGISSFRATSPSGVDESFVLTRDEAALPRAVHARKGEAISLPWPGRATSAARDQLSLLEDRGGGFLRDAFDAMSISGGALIISGLTPGDYDLRLKDQETNIALRVTDGAVRNGWLTSKKRLLEASSARPLLLRKITPSKEELELSFANAGAETRVHVIATRFLPAHSLWHALGCMHAVDPEQVTLSRAISHYVSGRDIGDEYRYILERRYAQKFPGTMLSRPGLLLNPWAIRKTSMDRAQVAVGGAYAASAKPQARSAAPGQPMYKLAASEPRGQFANLDFLAEPARVLSNLRPGPDGVVRVPLTGLEGYSFLRILAVDGESLAAIYREVELEEPDANHQDLRLRTGLDPNNHFTEKKQSTVLDAGGSLVVEDITTSNVERFDTLARAHRVLATLSNDTKLAEFSFILDWPKLSDDQKRAKYSEFACHELSFFLSRKDRAFFTSVIQPYLRHKKDKTFMDHYLLEDDLADYLEPWNYGRLNILERILLAQRISGESGPTARHVRERFELIPPDIEAEDHFFKTAIKGAALDADEKSSFGFEEAKKSAIADKVAAMPASAPMRSLAGPAGGRAKKRARKEAQRAADMSFDAEADAAPEEAGEDMTLDQFESEAPMGEVSEGGDGGGAAMRDRDATRRAEVRQLYRKIDKTEEWAENNYYKLRIEEQGPELIPVSAFWKEYAEHDPRRPFVSASFPKAARNFTEMLCALAVLDLPFEASEHKISFVGSRMEMVAGSRTVVFHQEIKTVAPKDLRTPILISQNYFRQDDRYEYDGNEHHDKFVTGEMLVHVVYLVQVVLTNPSSSRQKLQLLLQIPRGALPVSNGFYTKSMNVHLEPYGTQSIEVAFYFPAPGAYPHFPAHAAKNEELIAAAPPSSLAVVERLSKVDQTSWAWISQNAATPAEVLNYLKTNNIERLDLSKIAWRVSDKAFFESVLALLTERHTYHDVLWSYAIKHRDLRRAAEYLRHQDPFLRTAGIVLESPWLTIDPVTRRWYEHLEYAPLVNARAHKLGSKTRILNDAFAAQYRRFLEMVTYLPKPTPAQLAAATYYLLLQDRVSAAIEMLKRAGELGGLQGDYLRSYVAFHLGDAAGARSLAEPHKDHPVDRWRKLFRNVLAQLDELKGGAAEIVDTDDRAQRQARMASTQVSFDFSVEQKTVKIDYQNLRAVTVNYYLMDIELLFSRQPFVQQQSDRFAIIKPNASALLELPAGAHQHIFELPAQYHSANVIVELVAEGLRKAQANYAHELGVQVIDQYGQVRIAKRGSRSPVSKAYVKVYARMRGGPVEFYKDGYTDLRGAFDYATVSTDELDRVERFAILVMTEQHGAVIREAAPPKR